MEYLDWREELRFSQERILTLGCKGEVERLRGPIGEVIEHRLLVVESTASLREVTAKLKQQRIECALVQDTPDTMQGVIRQDALHAALITLGARFDRMVVSHLMDRNICVEPETAPLIDVMNRMVFGGSACVVLIDDSGKPSSAISPRTILDALSLMYPELIENEEPGDMQVESHSELYRAPLH